MVAVVCLLACKGQHEDKSVVTPWGEVQTDSLPSSEDFTLRDIVANGEMIMLDGKIYACARGASLFQLGFIQGYEEAFVDVRESQNLRGRITNFFEQDANIVCDYCSIADAGRPVKAGEQVMP